jgi:hypothetical protein
MGKMGTGIEESLWEVNLMVCKRFKTPRLFFLSALTLALLAAVACGSAAAPDTSAPDASAPNPA